MELDEGVAFPARLLEFLATTGIAFGRGEFILLGKDVVEVPNQLYETRLFSR